MKARSEQAGILVLGKIAATLSDALTPFIIVRLLGKTDVGALSALMLVYVTLVVMLTAGFPRAVLYFLPDRDRDARWAVLRRILAVMVALGAVTGLCLLGIGFFGDSVLDAVGAWVIETFGTPDKVDSTEPADEPYLHYLALLAIYPLFDIPVRVLPNLLIVENRPRAAASMGMIRSIGMGCGTLIPAAVGWGLWGIVGGLVLFGVVHGGILLGFLRSLYKGTTAIHPPVSRRELIRFAIPLGMTDIVNMLNGSLDRYLILFIFPAAAFAEYRMGAWQIPVVTTVAYSVSTVYMSQFVGLFKEGRAREVLRIWQENIAKVSLIVVPVAAVFVVGAEEFVTLAFTEDYLGAAPVFRLYCLLTMARVAGFGDVMVSAGKPSYVLRAAGFTLVSNALISVPLVLTLGFVGPALGTVVAFVPTVVYYCIYIAKAARATQKEGDDPVRAHQVFPLWVYFRVVLVAAVPAGAAVWLKLTVLSDFHAALALLLEALVVLGGFALLGTLLRLISREDWRFAGNWVRLKILKN